MSSKEEPSKCCPAAAPISSFTIRSILGSGSAEPPREAGGRATAWPARARTLSLSSEDEEPEESWKQRGCLCPEAHGPAEPCRKLQPLGFTCLGEYRRDGTGRDGADGARRPPGRVRESSAPARPPLGGLSHPPCFRGRTNLRRPWLKRGEGTPLKTGWPFFFPFHPTPPHPGLIPTKERDAIDKAHFLKFCFFTALGQGEEILFLFLVFVYFYFYFLALIPTKRSVKRNAIT